MKSNGFLLCLIILFLIPSYSFSQANDNRVEHAFETNYSFNFPLSDLKTRYGNHSEIGLKYRYYYKSLSFNLNGNFLFGGSVKDTTTFDNITTSEGELIDINGQYADVRRYQRGGYFSAGIGVKIFKYKDLTFYNELNTGYFFYRTRIENPGNTLPNLSKEYVRGYDQLTGGLCFRNFFGFHYLGEHHLVNFTFGINYSYSNSSLIRNYDYKLQSYVNKKFNDQFIGLQVGWIVPFYKAPSDKVYEY